MPKLVFLIKRNAALSPDEFRAYYEDRHVPFALQFIQPFLVDYRRSYPTGNFSFSGNAAEGAAPPPSPWTYDCITEMWFDSHDSVRAMMAILAKPDVRAIMTEDEERFIDRKSVVILAVDERQSSFGATEAVAVLRQS